jgi:hypothetical protein
MVIVIKDPVSRKRAGFCVVGVCHEKMSLL